MTLIATESTEVLAAPEAVWQVVADIENMESIISGIKAIDILETPPGPTITGIKWTSFYETRAENHGSLYISRKELEITRAGTRLTMTFNCQPITFGAKVMWLLTGWMAKKSLSKTIRQDLADIKAKIEKA